MQSTQFIRAAGMVAMATAGIVLGAARPAHSWVHPVDVFQRYFQPDGDLTQNDWIRGCIVSTGLFKDPSGDQAVLNTYSGVITGLQSHCAPFEGYITIVTFDGAKLKQGLTGVTHTANRRVTGTPQPGDDFIVYRAVSKGDFGDALVGAHVCATNTNALITCWDITAF